MTLLSEEGSESNNKIVRFIREHLTRKMSRRQTMEDLMHRLIAVSDPLVLHYNREEVLKHRAKIRASLKRQQQSLGLKQSKRKRRPQRTSQDGSQPENRAE